MDRMELPTTGERRQADRRSGQIWLTEEQIDKIAEEAAKKAVALMVEQAYQEVGKAIINKAMWFIGVVTLGIGYWLNSKGLIKFQ